MFLFEIVRNSFHERWTRLISRSDTSIDTASSRARPNTIYHSLSTSVTYRYWTTIQTNLALTVPLFMSPTDISANPVTPERYPHTFPLASTIFVEDFVFSVVKLDEFFFLYNTVFGVEGLLVLNILIPRNLLKLVVEFQWKSVKFYEDYKFLKQK